MSLPSIPSTLLPSDGRFGCGPSRIPASHTDAVATSPLMGTSHRQPPVKNLVGSIRSKISTLFTLPDSWKVVLGNGGSTTFWAVATTSLVHRRVAHATFGEFGNKFAQETSSAPFLEPSVIVKANPGEVAILSGNEGCNDGSALPDVFAYPHHETSTGALSPIYRAGKEGALTVVDATSIAGALPVNFSAVDVYYFSPQKCFASDGGLWVALLSPAAQERARSLHEKSDRWMPQILDLSIAMDNSIKNQTLNTPAIATLIMFEKQLDWMLKNGGLKAMQERCRALSGHLYQWAEKTSIARPFVTNSDWRSPVVVTIDFSDDVDASLLARVLRNSGIVDVDPYRKLKRNQLRIATFPTTTQADVEALTACIDWTLEHL